MFFFAKGDGSGVMSIAETTVADDSANDGLTHTDAAEDNTVRAAWAAQAAATFALRTGIAHENDATILGNLLSDLMHLCDRVDVPFGLVLNKGRNHYDEEVRGG